jgi:hypothetical protein
MVAGPYFSSIAVGQFLGGFGCKTPWLKAFFGKSVTPELVDAFHNGTCEIGDGRKKTL